ncbi:MAG TPA: D-glycero-beta-D-manno-heptose 1-phosphate adenylyltransferase [Candidatus Pacebacteria bacterium]|nr:D-glycero-beta-D-manno-heptose 1-phosphate adenylyltransferase [Candidatus Paceibacterota bacterium]
MLPSPKIINNLEDLEPILTKHRQAGRKIVLTQGSWDMVHVGHARYLAEAKAQGDLLVVGVDSDEKVKRRKGPGRPVVPEAERLEMLTHLSAVDYVILKNAAWPKFTLVKMLKPDVLVATKDTYSDSAKLVAVKSFCGQVVVLNPMATTSTSAKIRLVQLGAAKKIETKLLKAIQDVLEEYKT